MVLMQVFMQEMPAVEKHMFLRTSALDCTGHMQHNIAIGSRARARAIFYMQCGNIQ